MNTIFKILTVCFVAVISTSSFSQNQTKKWCFGGFAGLDFMTTPPSIFTDSMYTSEACASIADNAGNLLFYTNGVKVWNQNNLVMANGSGLLGHTSATQGAMIVKQPGNANLYYLFTLDQIGYPNGLRYSIVDMSLAAGMGSVTIKNIPVYTPCTEKLTAVLHCNRTDVWVVSHDLYTNVFRSHLLTSAGLGTAVTSSVGAVHSGTNLNVPIGQMKISPNGKRIGVAIHGGVNLVQVFDFDNTTGIVSNPVTLNNNSKAYGCEFSPDGTKFYITVTETPVGSLSQFDLCAGSPALMAASQTTLFTNAPGDIDALQLGPDGRIYVAHTAYQAPLGVINLPNNAGTACNYVDNGQPVAPNYCQLGLPGFVTSLLRTIPPFTYTSTCQTVSFTASGNSVATFTSCSAAGYSGTTASWNFGDPGSGAANLAQGWTPAHVYSASGTYTPQLVISGPCSGDTLRQVITVMPAPSFSITGPGIICAGATVSLGISAAGSQTFSWSTGSTSATIAVSPLVPTIYSVTATDPISGCSSSKTYSVQVSPCTFLSSLGAGSGISVFPNPASDQLTIALSSKAGSKELQLRILDITGAEVKRETLQAGKGQHLIEILEINEGLYTILISSGGELVYSSRFSKK